MIRPERDTWVLVLDRQGHEAHGVHRTQNAAFLGRLKGCNVRREVVTLGETGNESG